jgi:hypothetical protein
MTSRTSSRLTPSAWPLGLPVRAAVTVALGALLTVPLWSPTTSTAEPADEAGSTAKPAEDVERTVANLGEKLTPMGSIRAGNAEGTIPEWTGGITEPPPEYEPGMHHPNPFADDEIQLTITSENMDEYRDKLSAGTQAMLEKYSQTYRVHVYPTRRSASYPERVYEALIQNAKQAELTANGNGVRGAAVASPFPLAENGLQAIWNHKLRYIGERLERTVAQVTPQRDGDYTVVKLKEEVQSDYSREGVTPETVGNRVTNFMQTISAPARLAGRILLVHETLNQVAEPRQAWTYNPGQRRVRRAPNVAYDNPGTASDGLRTNDNFDMFNGSPDRYDWELVGRREMYVPYNAYELHSDELSLDDVIDPGHLNTDHMRWELHRVWVVEARLKPGTSHIYARRTFYLDEDSWNVLLVDHYDGRDQLWRVGEGHTINYYEVPLVTYTVETIYDLQAGRYIALGMKNEEQMQVFNGEEHSGSYFTPAGLRTRGRR